MSYHRQLAFVLATSLGVASAAYAQAPAAEAPAAQKPASQTQAPQTPAGPQTGTPTRVRGVVEAVEPHELRLTTTGGKVLSLKMADNAGFTWIEPIAVTSIKPGAYIGTAAVAQPDGTLRALEVQVFPESMRGVGEGHQPWDLGSNSTMTNGTVGNVKVSNGRTLTVTYKGGEQTVFVPEKAPVITFAPATATALKKGEHVIVFAVQGPDDTLTARRVGIGRNGMVPPL